MNGQTRTRRIAALVSTVGALLVLAGSAQAATSKPAGMSQAEYRALMIRSQALNDKYGVGKPVGKPAAMSQAEYRALMIRSQALNDKYGVGKPVGKPPAMSQAEYRALMIRSQALNEKYGVGGSAVKAPVSKPQPSVVAGEGFAWGDFGIGAAAMLGFVLLAGGVIAGSRYGRRVPRTRISS